MVEVVVIKGVSYAFGKEEEGNVLGNIETYVSAFCNIIYNIWLIMWHS